MTAHMPPTAEMWRTDQVAAVEAFLCCASEGHGPTPIMDGDTCQLEPCPEWKPKGYVPPDPTPPILLTKEHQHRMFNYLIGTCAKRGYPMTLDAIKTRRKEIEDDHMDDASATEGAQDKPNGSGGTDHPPASPKAAPAPRAQGNNDELVRLDIRSSWAIPPPAREWLVDGWLPANRIAMLSGRGAAGKSQIALQLAHAITRESTAGGSRSWFEGGPDIPGGQGSVAFTTWEDDSDEFLRRMLGDPKNRNGTLEFDKDVGGRFHFIDLAGQGPLWAIGAARDSYGELTPVGISLRATCDSLGVRLLVVDALSSAFAANENERAAVRAFLSSWDRWARDTGCAVLLIAHPPKSDGPDNHYSGSTDWRAGVRSLLVLSRPKGVADRAKILCDKLNSAQTPDPIALGSPRWWEKIEVDPLEIDDPANLELRERVVDAIKEHGPMNRTQIRATIQKGKTAVDEMLARLEMDKTLGMTQDGNAKFYSLEKHRAEKNRAADENTDPDIPF